MEIWKILIAIGFAGIRIILAGMTIIQLLDTIREYKERMRRIHK